MAEEKPASESTLQGLTEQLKEQNFKLTQIRNIGEAQVEAAADAARDAREAAREAARAADDEGPEVAVKIEMEDESGGMWKKLKLGSLITSLLGFVSTGISTAMTWLGNAFGPKLLLKFKGMAPWALILTGLSMAIQDGITGMFEAEDMGVSKTAGFFGGFLGGGAKGGIKNAFKNMGKFALMGAGIGALLGAGIFSIPGAIIGGLLGAAIGGILGYIGAEKIAKTFDKVGDWFKKQFDDLILGPIKAVWDLIAPDWAKSVTDTMQWSDLLPPGLTKLFNGEYFTFDFPEFTWTDLFPKFLVDLFNNVAVAAKEADFKWTDLMPKFLVKFFAGEYSKEGSFEWSDLLPDFITKIIGVATTAWAETPFTWRSLVPNFILKIIDGFKQTGEFSWMDLVPKFISDLVAAGAAEATKTGPFSWKALLPDWMIGAWDSTVGLAKQSYFSFKNLLPEWMQPYITSAEGAVSSALGKVGSWNWKSLLPKFIQDFIADPTQLASEEFTFNWKDLLPQFIRDFLGDKKIDQAAETVGLAMDWWKSLLPDFILNIMEGKSPFADRDEDADLKKAEEAKKKLGEGVAELTGGDAGGGLADMFNLGTLMAPIRDKITTLLDPATAPWGLGKFTGFLQEKLLAMIPSATKMAEGGLVGMSKMGPQSMGAAMGLESGGLFTLSQGEFVLDNQAAATFLQAAMILKGQDLSGPNLANLQRDSVGGSMQVNQAPIIVTNSPTTQINQSSGVMLPLSPIRPSNTESALT